MSLIETLKKRLFVEQVGGEIASHGLEEWWFSTFTKEERVFIAATYQPMGLPPGCLIEGSVYVPRQDTPQFLHILAGWFSKKEHQGIAEKMRAKGNEIARLRPTVAPGYLDGRHFTTYVEEVKALKREGRLEEAAELLHKLIAAVEAESAAEGTQVAPWYYEHLGIVYRKLKRPEDAQRVAKRLENLLDAHEKRVKMLRGEVD